MEPITVNLSGLSELGPLAYIVAAVVATMFFGIVSWRSIIVAGRVEGGKKDSQIAVAIVAGVAGLVNMIVSLEMVWEAFRKTL